MGDRLSRPIALQVGNVHTRYLLSCDVQGKKGASAESRDLQIITEIGITLCRKPGGHPFGAGPG